VRHSQCDLRFDDVKFTEDMQKTGKGVSKSAKDCWKTGRSM
jgi:hypothetical protein